MKIYGVAILAACFLAGQLTGDLLGRLLQIDGNIGGVGFAMLLLMFCSDWMKRKNYFREETGRGILFWSAMYIPVVIAMAATQNVKAAVNGGFVAIVVGVVGTFSCLLLVPLIARLSKKNINPPQ